MKLKQPVAGVVFDVWDNKGKHIQHYEDLPTPMFGPKEPQLTITDYHGDVIVRQKCIPMDSYVENFLRIQYIHFGAGALNMVDTGGTTRSTNGGNNFIASMAASGTDTYGIVVGTSTTAVVLDDTKLLAQLTIVDGLTHGAMQYDTWTTLGTTTSFVLKRRFTNTTGSTMNVNEVGIYGKTAFPNYMMCYVREVLGAAWPIVAGGTTEFAFTVPITLGHKCATNLAKLYQNAFVDGAVNKAQNTSNAEITVPTGNPIYAVNAPSTNTAYGIVVGTGTTAVAVTDYGIGTLIAHGSGSGQLSYQAVLFDPIVTTASTAYMGVKRTLNNLHATTDVTITEIALIMNHSNNMFLGLRSVLTGSVTVPANGGTAQAKFLYGIDQSL